MVGDDFCRTRVGTCGKHGQSVPVGVGQPSLLIDQLTVGGTRTDHRAAARWIAFSRRPGRRPRPPPRAARAAPEQLAEGVRWLALPALGVDVAHQLAELLAVHARVSGQQFLQRRVAFFQQALAPCFNPVQQRGFLARGTRRRHPAHRGSPEGGIVFAPHLLGRYRSCRLRAMWESMRRVSWMCGSRSSGSAACPAAPVAAPPAVRPGRGLPASRRCWLRLGPRYSPVSSSIPRMAWCPCNARGRGFSRMGPDNAPLRAAARVVPPNPRTLD